LPQLRQGVSSKRTQVRNSEVYAIANVQTTTPALCNRPFPESCVVGLGQVEEARTGVGTAWPNEWIVSKQIDVITHDPGAPHWPGVLDAERGHEENENAGAVRLSEYRGVRAIRHVQISDTARVVSQQNGLDTSGALQYGL